MADIVYRIKERVKRAVTPTATLLLVSVKAEGLKHQLNIPVPFLFVDGVLEAGIGVAKIGRWTHASWYRKFAEDPTVGEFLKKSPDAIRELIYELKRVGPLTLVDVKEGDHTRVKIRLI